MADARLSGRDFVAIVETFSSSGAYRRMVENLPSQKQASANASLNKHGCLPSGIYIGGTGNYKLFVEDVDGDVTPYLDIAGGIIHPISAASIRKDNHTYTTDAPNVIVLY